MAEAAFGLQVVVLVGIALIMTIGVYGLVAGIVKLDDAGLYLSRSASRAAAALGRGILRAAPYMMKGLSVAGTIAMFLVGGGILVHGFHPAQEWLDGLARQVGALAGVGPLLGALAPLLLTALAGVAAGAVALIAVSVGQRLFQVFGRQS